MEQLDAGRKDSTEKQRLLARDLNTRRRQAVQVEVYNKIKRDKTLRITRFCQQDFVSSYLWAMDWLDVGNEIINGEWKHQQMDKQLKRNEQVQEAITVNDKAATREKTDHANVP